MENTYLMMKHLASHATLQCNSTYQNWTWTIFGECVTDRAEFAGFLFGLISIGFWLIVFFPQFYESYKSGNADQAIAPLFLIMWLLGDASNLAGCLLSHQLKTQIYVAYYYILADVCILTQFTYYKIKNRRKVRVLPDSNRNGVGVYGSTNPGDPKNVIYCMMMFNVLSLTTLLSWQPGQQVTSHHTRTGRTLLAYEGKQDECMVPFGNSGDCMFFNSEDLTGYIFGVVSGLCYFLSRSPQIYKNFKRKSVEGVSIFMFVNTVMGNLTYGLSVILEDTSLVFLARHLPWLVGSIGTLIFDATLLVQFAIYRRGKTSTPLSGETDPLIA